MNKEARIGRYGEAAYKRELQQANAWYVQHRKEANARDRVWREANRDKVIAYRQETRKGGKYYNKRLEYEHTPLRDERNKIRGKHNHKYRSFKQIIAPTSQIHHEWVPGTAEYRGVALVEKDQHMHGFVDVIKILEGKITLLEEGRM